MPQDTKGVAQADVKSPVRISSRDLIESVRTMLSAPHSSQMEITRRIEQLQAAVVAHFGNILEQGIFEETVFHAPWLTPLSECLRQQHAELEAVLEQLVSLARNGDGGAECRREMLTTLDELAELFLEVGGGFQNLKESRQGWVDEDP